MGFTHLSYHEDFVGLGKFRELLERGHEALVVVAAAGSINENNIVTLLGSLADGVLGDGGGVTAVALLEDLDAAALALRQLLEVADVDLELLDCTGPEGIARRDQHAVLVLQQEVADLGQVRRLAHAVDADDGDDVRPRPAPAHGRRPGDGVDVADEVERRRGRQHLGQRRLHGGGDARVDALEAARLDADELLLHALAEPDRGLARHVLAQQVVLHPLHGLLEVGLSQGLTPYHVAEKAADGA